MSEQPAEDETFGVSRLTSQSDPALLSDERLMGVLFEWWFNQPVSDTKDDRAAAVEDIRSMLEMLRSHGYRVVRNGGGS